MATNRVSESGVDRAVTLSLLAAPGLACRIAERVTEGLGDSLAEQLGHEVSWQVQVVTDTFVGAGDVLEVLDHADRRRCREGWDFAV